MKPKRFLIFIFLFSASTYAQVMNDSVLVSNQIKETIQLYDQFLGTEARIYSGRDYIPYKFKKEGTPFFLSEEPEYGWVSFDGRVYDSVLLQYDVSRNQVIIVSYDSSRLLILQNELIDSFHFLNFTFVQLNGNLPENLKNDGFYQKLYDGNSKILVLRKKDLHESIVNGTTLTRSFVLKDKYYILKRGKYYQVNNRNDVFGIFGDKAGKVRVQMRHEGIEFKRFNFEEGMVAAAKIYDQLIQ